LFKASISVVWFYSLYGRALFLSVTNRGLCARSTYHMLLANSGLLVH
jgi:hypothetical protein